MTTPQCGQPEMKLGRSLGARTTEATTTRCASKAFVTLTVEYSSMTMQPGHTLFDIIFMSPQRYGLRRASTISVSTFGE